MAKESPHVQQLRNELENCRAYGQTARAASIERSLEAAGVEVAAEKRREAAQDKPGGEQEARDQPPRERREPTRQTADATPPATKAAAQPTKAPERKPAAEKSAELEQDKDKTAKAQPRKRGDRLDLG